MSRFELAGRTALVTGGSAGIGLALARGLLAQGATRVLVVGRNQARLDAAVHELGPAAVALQVDLSRATEVDRLLGLLPGLAPDLSVVFNNAGSQRLTDFTRDDPAALLPALRSEIAANFEAVLALSVGLLPLLGRQPSAALKAGQSEIDVGKTRLLRVILRVSPALGARIMRAG